MHAAAAQLHHLAAYAPQAHQVKFGVAVGAAHAPGLRGREHAVGAHHLLRGHIAHQQVLAVIVKQVDVVARRRRVQPRAHFAGKDFVPQSLRLPNFIEVLRPPNLDAACCHRRNHRA